MDATFLSTPSLSMALFDDDPTHNLLPQDGEVYYHGTLCSLIESDLYFKNLYQDIPWQADQILMQGRLITTTRKVAWYGDNTFAYTYSGMTKQALPWTLTLLDLKQRVEKQTAEHYNSCLLNLYQDGHSYVGWHSDNERTLKQDAAIASLSFGVQRNFVLKHKKTAQTISIALRHGSLLVMKGKTQTFWKHTLPKSLRILEPRINLTFRTFCKDQ